MNLKKFAPKTKVAQAMVEFAIILPILLMLLYGILETGRLLFMYSTIVTASRQAVRYGSATGQGAVSAVPRYQDCAGIRLAAQKVDYLNSFSDADIVIKHDSDPTTDTDDLIYCGGSPLPASDTTYNPPDTNADRIIVEVTGHYNMIVRLVPFGTRNIVSESARTILVSVPIEMSPTGGVAPTNTPTDTPTPTATFTPSVTFTPTETPLYTYTPSYTPPPTFTLPPSPIPSATFTATPTLPTTPTFTPTPTPTNVLGCGNITTDPLDKRGSTMRLTIHNPNPYAVTVKDITVVWNDDTGHGLNGLKLTNASLTPGTQFWSSESPAGQTGPLLTIDPAKITPPAIVTIPSGDSTLIFTFDKSYTTWDYTEEISITLSTPGCELFGIRRTNPKP